MQKEKHSRRHSNNSLAIKQSQGPLVSPRRLQVKSRASSSELFCSTETSTSWKKLTVCLPQAYRPPDWQEPES